MVKDWDQPNLIIWTIKLWAYLHQYPQLWLMTPPIKPRQTHPRVFQLTNQFDGKAMDGPESTTPTFYLAPDFD